MEISTTLWALYHSSGIILIFWLISQFIVWLNAWFECVQVCCVYTGMTFEVKTEADSYDITEHPHDDKPRPYLCTVCDKRFRMKGDLKRHKQIHTGHKLYLCTRCEKRFATQDYLSKHMKIHSSKCKCTECGKCFSSNQELTVHRRIHSGEKPFECTVCSKRFTQSTHLVSHGRIHSGEKPHKCRECDKAFSQSGDLNTHMRVHTGDKPYKCSVCDVSFSTSSNLQSHKRHAHSNRRPYDCRYCGRLFKSSRDLKFHVYTHTGAKPYSCRHCSDCFKGNHQLKAHLLKSHNEGTWFTCHICQKKFSMKGNLKKHLLRHEGVKLYVCSECSMSFFTESELRKHQLKHSDFKNFCCGSCGEYFKRKDTVISHFNRCSVKLGYVNIFARQDWVTEQTICGQLLIGQSCCMCSQRWFYAMFLIAVQMCRVLCKKVQLTKRVYMCAFVCLQTWCCVIVSLSAIMTGDTRGQLPTLYYSLLKIFLACWNFFGLQMPNIGPDKLTFGQSWNFLSSLSTP